MDDYPTKFNTSSLSDEEKEILLNFFNRRKIFDKYLHDNKINLFTCPSCGYPEITERDGYKICSICNWEDDGQDDESADEIWEGPNSKLSLSESRLNIGKILKQLANDLNGKINLDPETVLRITNMRDKLLAKFSEDNIAGDTPGNDPVYTEWKRLHTDTLAQLIKK